MKLNLKPCPFCGGHAALFYDDPDDTHGWSVNCDEDDCSFVGDTGWQDSKEAAIAVWNKRPAENELLEALKTTLTHLVDLHGEDAYGSCDCSVDECTCFLSDDYNNIVDVIKKYDGENNV